MTPAVAVGEVASFSVTLSLEGRHEGRCLAPGAAETVSVVEGTPDPGCQSSRGAVGEEGAEATYGKF